MADLPIMLLQTPLQRTLVTDVLVLLGLGLIALVVVLHLRRYRREAGGSGGAGRPGAVGLTPREEIERGRQERALRGQLEEVLTGLEQAAEKLGRDLDAKAARLEKLIAEAEGRIARLEELEGREAGVAEEVQGTKCKVQGAEGETRQAEERPRGRGAAPGTPGVPGFPGAPLPAAAPAEGPVDPVTRCVYELADKGLEPMEIARQLDQHIGKVELILALREV